MKTLLCLTLIILCSLPSNSQNATIKETSQIFRTYGYSDPDPVARPGKIYPYYRFDGYTDTPVDKEWKIIELENEWIKVLIAPEIGGKILGAIEKSTGNEFLYLNKVIKFRDVAMRGAWTSGGIEFNFGSIGHAPSTASPVNYMIRENPDGSVSCFLGDMDITSRTQWRVEVRLPNDKAWFETHSSWYNPTDFSTSKYHWMNAAADATDDLTYYWPGTHYIGHPGDSHAWPVMADGRDISQYSQNDYGTYHSYHVLGEISDYYGGYYSDKDFGFGHLTDYATKPGKKIWIWGLARQGEIWVELLTDPDLGNGQYTEIQTGLLFNQAALQSTKTPYKHLDFKSQEVERFTEYWFPVKETKGISDINEYGIVHIQDLRPGTQDRNQTQDLRPNGEDLEIRFCALQAIEDSVFIKINDSLTYSFYANLQPMETYVGKISPSHKATKPPSYQATRPQKPSFNITLSSNPPGKQANPTSSDRPRSSPKFDWNSIQGKYLSALEFSKQREYAKAIKGYYACLEEDQNYIPALIGASEELMRTMKYENAENLLNRILSIDTYHPKANYLYGILKKQNGEYHRAKEAFGLSTRSMEFRSSGYAQLAEVAFMMEDYKKSLLYGESALDYNRFNINAYQTLVLANRFLGKTNEAAHTAEVILELDPLNHMALFERWLAYSTDGDLDYFKSMIQTEFPEQVYLELALYYYKMGANEDAMLLLNQAPENILISYLKAYLTRNTSTEHGVIPAKAGTAVQSFNTSLGSTSPLLTFPFRPEMHKAIYWAEEQSSHWQNRYFLGLMAWNFGDLDEARRLFKSCGDEPDFAAFYLARTKLFDGIDSELLIHDLDRALKIEPDSWRSYKYMVEFYMKNQAYAPALDFARKAGKKFKDNFIIQADLAKAELYNGNYDKCLKILDGLVILPAEGAQAGHDLYRQAHLLKAVEVFKDGKAEKALGHIAKAREWPENLGVGRAYICDERVEDYLEGLILMSENKDPQAIKSFQKILDYTAQNKPSWDSPHLLLAYSLQMLGQGDQAIKILSDWMKAKPQDAVVHWASAMYADRSSQAEQALSNYRNPTGGSPWNPGGGDPQFKLVYEIVNQIKWK